MAALKVGDLLKIPTLHLTTVAGGGGLSNSIRWVHVSELEDPTPWLKGGELLLTTGMGVGGTPAKQRAYIRRLMQAGLAGLGFGLGFSFGKVPKAMTETAEEASFPLFTVPYPVPFIAITEAVFSKLAAEQYDLLSRSLEAEHNLTRAVLEGRGLEGIVASLSRATGGWALLLDLHGSALTAVPASARSHGQRVWSELRSSRVEGVRFSLSVLDRGHHISIQPVSAQGRVEAFLAVGKRQALSQFDRIVSSHALALLALEMAKARAVSDTERRLRGDILDQLLRGPAGLRESRQALRRFGFDLGQPVLVVAVSGPDPNESLARACEAVLAELTGAYLVSEREDLVLAVVQPGDDDTLSRVRAGLASRSSGDVAAGAGSLVPVEQLPQGVREARYALRVCQTEGRPEARFSDLGTYQLLLSLQEPEALRTFASSVLAPLDEYDKAHEGNLVTSLRAFLEHNARWEAAAADLFVHRHTLRYRMRKVQQLSGRDLSSPRDRMEFFLALRARDLLDSGDAAVPGGALSYTYNVKRTLSPSASPSLPGKG